MHFRIRRGVAGLLVVVAERGLAATAANAPCPFRTDAEHPAIRAVVVIAGEDDPGVARGVRSLGANTMATLTPPRLDAAEAAEGAGLAYLPRLSTREVDRLPYDAAQVASIRSLPAISGIQYLDEEVTEGFASPATQARAYGILKALFPNLLALHATRLDLVATVPGYLDSYFRPEFTDLVAPYFYPVGTTVLGTYEEADPWEERLRSLLRPLAERVPPGKPVLPVLQAYEQIGHPASGGLPQRQLGVYREFWPDGPHVAAFWWGGATSDPFLGISDRPWLARGVRRLLGALPDRPGPCRAPPRSPVESRP